MHYDTIEIEIRRTNALEVVESLGYISLFPEGSQIFALDQHQRISPGARHVEGVKGDFYRAMLWHKDTITEWENGGGWGESGYILEAEPDIIVSRVEDDIYKIEFNEKTNGTLVRSLDTEYIRRNLP